MEKRHFFSEIALFGFGFGYLYIWVLNIWVWVLGIWVFTICWNSTFYTLSDGMQEGNIHNIYGG